MKRDDKKALLASSVKELQSKRKELEAELVSARQERHMQDRTAVDVKRAAKLRKQIKMIKAELSRRQIEESK